MNYSDGKLEFYPIKALHKFLLLNILVIVIKPKAIKKKMLCVLYKIKNSCKAKQMSNLEEKLQTKNSTYEARQLIS